MKGGNKNDNIRVAVRVRPPLDVEIQAGNKFDNMKIDQKQKIVK